MDAEDRRREEAELAEQAKAEAEAAAEAEAVAAEAVAEEAEEAQAVEEAARASSRPRAESHRGPAPSPARFGQFGRTNGLLASVRQHLHAHPAGCGPSQTPRSPPTP